MAELKTGTTVNGAELTNINLEGVSRDSFSATHLSSITGITGGSGSSATVSKSATTLSSTGNSNIDLSNITDLRFDGVDRGYSTVYLNGTRIWEKFQSNDPVQVWVQSGHVATASNQSQQFWQKGASVLGFDWSAWFWGGSYVGLISRGSHARGFSSYWFWNSAMNHGFGGKEMGRPVYLNSSNGGGFSGTSLTVSSSNSYTQSPNWGGVQFTMGDYMGTKVNNSNQTVHRYKIIQNKEYVDTSQYETQYQMADHFYY